MKRKRILTIGGATQDIFIAHKDIQSTELESKQGTRSCLLFEQGKKIEVSDIIYATGGGATNSAASFQRLGFSVAVCSKVGNDLQAEFIIDSLKKETVDTSFIQRSQTIPTGVSFILPSANANSAILAYRGANKELSQADIPFSDFKQFDHLYITSLSDAASSVLLPICKQAHALSIPIATNPGSSQLEMGAATLCEALHYMDILILNKDEAQIFMRSLVKSDNVCFSIPNYCKAVLNYGPRIVVVTDGKEGVYIASGSTIYFHKSIPTTLVSTVGAGDAFGSCFVASIIQGFTLEEALVRGIVNASSVISFVTAKKGLLHADTLEQKIKAFGKPTIQIFPLI